MHSHRRRKSCERAWQRLLEFLNGFGSARETAPGRIVVSLEGTTAPQTVQLLITKHQWNDMVAMPWGDDFDSAAQAVRRLLSTLRPHERYLVYSDYGLIPSASEQLPLE